MNATNTSLLDDYVDDPTLAELDVTVRTVQRWRALPDGSPFVKLGARTLTNPTKFREWLAKRERRPNQRRREK